MEMKFQRGTYGEILLTPLIFNPVLEEAPLKVVGEERMTSDEGEALHDEVIHAIHQQNLQRILSGDVAGDVTAMVLYRAVMRGEPLNLYPVGLKRKEIKSFKPILRRVGNEQWRLGLPGQGRYAVVMGRTTLILQQVWQLYLEWIATETGENETQV